MKLKLITTAAVIAAATLVAGIPAARGASGSEDPAAFIQAANQINQTEIQMGQLAQQKSQSEQIKTLAQQIVTDHQANDLKLQALATQKAVTISAQLDSKHQAMVDKLSALNGAAFDKRYINDQVKGHKQAISLFQRASEKNSDADVKAFAQATLPTLQHHLEMAEQADKTITEPAGASK